MMSEQMQQELSEVLNGLRDGECDTDMPEAHQKLRQHVEELKKMYDELKDGRSEALSLPNDDIAHRKELALKRHEAECLKLRQEIDRIRGRGGATSSSSETASITILDEEEEKLNVIQWECVVCMDRFPFFACVPCGHLCLCQDCLQQMPDQRQCPVCMMTMTSTVRIYSCHPYPWAPLVNMGYAERASRRAYGRSNGNLREALLHLKATARMHHGPGSVEVLDLVAAPSPAREEEKPADPEVAARPPKADDEVSVISVLESAPPSPSRSDDCMAICDDDGTTEQDRLKYCPQQQPQVRRLKREREPEEPKAEPPGEDDVFIID